MHQPDNPPGLGRVDPRALGQRIASLRRASGWSQRRLAEAAGVSHGYVALLELGRLPSPGKFRLDAVARALNLRTSDALLNGTADAALSSVTAAQPSRVAEDLRGLSEDPSGAVRARPGAIKGSGVRSATWRTTDGPPNRARRTAPSSALPRPSSMPRHEPFLTNAEFVSAPPNVAGTLEQLRN